VGAYELSIITLISINVILALSLNLITGFCGQISLGHAAFFGVGAYATALVAKAGGPVWVALPVAITAAGVVGVLVGFCSLRVRDDFLAIATMGVGFLFLGVVKQNEALGGEVGISGIPGPALGRAGFLVLVLACAALVAAFCVYVKRCWLGAAFDAVAADDRAAQTIGIDSARFKLAAFALGTAIAGLAGGLYAYYLRSIGPEAFGFVVSITVLAMVAVGGMGSVAGSALAAAVLTLVPDLFRFVNDYKLLIYGLLLFAVMRFAPGGVAGVLARAWRRATP
jgi:branched-chain amino acid transport system permease protein